MENLHQVSRKIKAHVSNYEIEESFNLLSVLAKENQADSEISHIATILTARFENLKRDRIKGILSYADNVVEFNKIISSILDFADLINSKNIEPRPISEPLQFEILKAHSENKLITSTLGQGPLSKIKVSELLIPNVVGDSRWETTRTPSETKEISNNTVSVEGIERNLFQAIKDVWKSEQPHSIIFGDGGMGKTVSLVKVWEHFLSDFDTAVVPIYIPLHTFGNAAADPHLIQSYIEKYFLEDRPFNLDLLPDRDERTPPRIILLLDGLNELHDRKKVRVFEEVDGIIQTGKAIQVIITSRYLIRRGVFNRAFTVMHLTPLDWDRIEAYLGFMPSQRRLRQLLRTPMFLNIFKSSLDYLQKPNGLKIRIETKADLFAHYFSLHHQKATKIVKQEEAFILDVILRNAVPFIAFKMWQQGVFVVSVHQLGDLFEQFLLHLKQHEKFYLQKVELTDVKEAMNNLRFYFEKLFIQIACSALSVMSFEDHNIRFSHQYFRDYFCALFYVELFRVSIFNKKIESELFDLIQDQNILELIGQIEREHKRKPIYDNELDQWKKSSYSNNIQRLLKLCKNKFDDTKKVVLNLFEIMKKSRNDFAGDDFSQLDLTMLNLSGLRFSRHFEKRYLCALFIGSKIQDKCILSSEDYLGGSSHYSKYGYINNDTIMVTHYHCFGSFTINKVTKQIIATNRFDSMKEGRAAVPRHIWDTQEKLKAGSKKLKHDVGTKTYGVFDEMAGMYLPILSDKNNSLTLSLGNYSLSRDGKKVLLYFDSSFDYEIGEYLIETREYKTIVQDQKEVFVMNPPVYNLDASRVLFKKGFHLYEHDVETGECTFSFQMEHFEINQCFKILNEEKYLIRTGTKIFEWDCMSQNVSKVFDGHRKYVRKMVLSKDLKYLLSYALTENAILWDYTNGEIIRKYDLHSISDIFFVEEDNRLKIGFGNVTYHHVDGRTTASLVMYDVKDEEYEENLEEANPRYIQFHSSENNMFERVEKTEEIVGNEFEFANLYIQNCKFDVLHQGSNLSPKTKKLLSFFGGVV